MSLHLRVDMLLQIVRFLEDYTYLDIIDMDAFLHATGWERETLVKVAVLPFVHA